MEPLVTVRADDLQLLFDIVIDNGMLEEPEDMEMADRVNAILKAAK